MEQIGRYFSGTKPLLFYERILFIRIRFITKYQIQGIQIGPSEKYNNIKVKKSGDCEGHSISFTVSYTYSHSLTL